MATGKRSTLDRNSISTPPLVSVVIRTAGQPGLARALAAAAAQTWRPTEIVLVDAEAAGRELRDFADLPVRVVGADWPMDPARAANAGLMAARGEWIGFLDEDDTIEPEHVALLVETAARAELPVAYAQARLIAPDGVQRVYGAPFSRAALLRSDYIPLHAGIFSRAFVEQGVRFDESLGPVAEWDFWLQLAALTDFAYADTPTATYRPRMGRLAGMPPPEGVHEKLRQKWQAG